MSRGSRLASRGPPDFLTDTGRNFRHTGPSLWPRACTVLESGSGEALVGSNRRYGRQQGHQAGIYIYGMDESGFPPSDQGRQRVVGRRGTKTQHKSGSANRENVTVLVTICADETTLKPTIIFKGHIFLQKWGQDNRMRLLGVDLASKTSGACLVTKAKVTHLQMDRFPPPVLEHVPDTLPEPDWSILRRKDPLFSFMRSALEERCLDLEKALLQSRRLLRAHEVISEGQNAQLILQNMGMDKMKQTLFQKEKPKRSDRSVLFPGGKGRHLTDPEVIALKRADNSGVGPDSRLERESAKSAGGRCSSVNQTGWDREAQTGKTRFS
ncbi:hypothetical protein DFH09DRAFT_920423 [Mycena vulgaris]|nr:hypothetical protein DFH09DRAFT_920423 [Mycena vulgaris]